MGLRFSFPVVRMTSHFYKLVGEQMMELKVGDDDQCFTAPDTEGLDAEQLIDVDFHRVELEADV